MSHSDGYLSLCRRHEIGSEVDATSFVVCDSFSEGMLDRLLACYRSTTYCCLFTLRVKPLASSIKPDPIEAAHRRLKPHKHRYAALHPPHPSMPKLLIPIYMHAQHTADRWKFICIAFARTTRFRSKATTLTDPLGTHGNEPTSVRRLLIGCSIN